MLSPSPQHCIDVELLNRLLDEPAAAITEGLTILERARLLTFDGERYAFTAPLIALVVRSEFLTLGQRRTLQERAGALLATASDLQSRLLHAQLRAETHPSRDVAERAAELAREAMRTGAGRTARRALAAVDRAVRRGTEADHAFTQAVRKEVLES